MEIKNMNAAANIKKAQVENQVHELIKKRWSPYAYSDRPVSNEDLRSLFEAARWSASCYNDQPWYYIVATRDQKEEYDKLLSCLVEANQEWAQRAPVLALGVARSNFTHNGRKNRHALHDLGQASANLTVEATSRGLHVHQMAGIEPDKARKAYGIPDGFEVFTALAIGYAALPEEAPEELRKKDETPRSRRPLSETVFGGSWGQTHAAIDKL
jgi:nitroreductase